MFNLLIDILNNGIISVFIVVLFTFTIFRGIIKYNKLQYIFHDIRFYINIISLYLVYLSYDFIAYELYYLILKSLNINHVDNTLIGFILKIVLFVLAFIICNLMCRCIHILLFKNMVIKSHKFLFQLPNIFKNIIFGIIKAPKAILVVLIFIFALDTFSVFLTDNNRINQIMNSSNLYKNISSRIIAPFKYDLNEIMLNIFSPILETFEDIKTNNVKYLYNGVTIDEATKSTDEIVEFAIQSTKGLSTSYDKAKKLYDDVVNMLEYDEKKSNDILNEDFSNLSGAISAFESKRGICFDYASLYSVLAESIQLPTRIVVGKGYDGNSWINHAWNEVYIEESNVWIKVDTTFGETGNYFDINNFEQDHIRERVIWEFSV
ncbi:transglutaminase-like domain-containing protein [Candidatus Arthromitus sp. SFB-rat-Yit]|uniref:transglutaminase-like domain-containing protein n=1 Tax=Candidatus Arthromitus sp. SFB-rat-Yit TaxID=1041504 RepID=UPI000227A324|nr:transglutaminase-like domain-containing protein [Candidatus Arthromitus sp. SFB-rat-Yit]BAK81470.1 transglutaminase-like enzyme, putative cysteine protease [Candidatus Arthromitus sp. SFB-rat-Yit]